MAGKYFEELEPGAVFRHAVTRTVTEMDNVLFTTLTMNVQPLHLDEEFGRQSMFGQRLVNSIFTLGLVVGISVADTTLGTTVGNLGSGARFGKGLTEHDDNRGRQMASRSHYLASFCPRTG